MEINKRYWVILGPRIYRKETAYKSSSVFIPHHCDLKTCKASEQRVSISHDNAGAA